MNDLRSSSSNKAVFEDEGSLILPGFRLRRHPSPLAAGPCKAGKAVGWPKGLRTYPSSSRDSGSAGIPPRLRRGMQIDKEKSALALARRGFSFAICGG